MAIISDEEIRAFANNLNLTSSGFNDLVSGLILVNNANQAAANSALKSVTARSVELELIQKRLDQERAYIQLWQTLGSSLTRSITGLGSFSAQLYASTNAFQAASLTLDTVGSIFKSLTQIIKDGLGPFEKLFGIGNALKNITDAGADIVLSAMKNRLEQARIITDTIQTVGKAGATFGGSIGELIESAGRSKINLQEFGKFIATSAKDLVGFGQSISRSSADIGRLGFQVGEANNDLLVLKGSFGELASSAAEYMTMQRLAGVNTRRESERSATAIAEYIRQQNMLTELTGLSVTDQRRQAEERRNIAAYNVEVSKLDKEARTNLDTTLSLIGQQAGPKIQAVAVELFSNQGRLINQRSIQLMQTMPGMLEYLQSMLSNIRKPAAEFAVSLGRTVKESQPILRDLVQALSDAGFLQLSAGKIQNEVIQDQAEFAVYQQRSAENMENADKIIDDLLKRFAAGRTEEDTEAVANTIKTYNQQKQALDNLAKENLKTLSSIVSATGTIAQKLIEAEMQVSKFANMFITPGIGLVPKMQDFSKAMEKAIRAIFGLKTEESEAASRQSPEELSNEQLTRRIRAIEDALLRATTVQRTVANDMESFDLSNDMQKEINALRQELWEARKAMSQRPRTTQGSPPGDQEGGIATEPTIVGENNQPEAVIPLARGNIPLNIDFNPMLRIMEQQREYLEEMASANNRNMDFLERIYHAVS